MNASPGAIAGIDVGGTFTDLLVVDGQGRVRFAKTPTTLDNQAHGVMNALSHCALPLSGVDAIVHGTTTTTNAVLERKLARTGMITTRGFRDIIELGRRTRPQAYGMFGTFTPLIPRSLRLEVDERLDARGRVLTPLDVGEFETAVKTLLAQSCESLVIHFLHAYANPQHELQAAALAASLWPNAYITTGHSLLSEYREYERGVTACVNASVQPILDRYIHRLTEELTTAGYRRELLVMNGNGGMVSAGSVAREAAKTVMSGPASGVMAAAYTGKRAGIDKLITYDMGGTSSDVALILDAVPSVSHELELEYAMPIHVPMVDVRTIGSGGGSIASINDAGLLQVGPESAGASPGPICYGRGGTHVTISDANLALGRLNADKLLAVDNAVSLRQINQAIDQQIGQPLKLSTEAAAGAILTIANNKMAGAVRMVSLSRGHDPREFALFAFGGAGPLHAVAIARELRVPTVLIPARPGITNALGCVVADLRHDFVNTINRPLHTVDRHTLQQTLEQQTRQGLQLIEDEPVSIESVECRHSADMQFVGQTHLLNVPVPSTSVTTDELQTLFENAYRARFHVELSEIRANLVNLNTTVIGYKTPIDLSVLIDSETQCATLQEAQTQTRPVWFDQHWYDTPIYQRELLPADATIEGPAIIEQLDTTIVIEPGCTADSDNDGNLLIKVELDV
jgi:N-methylhydantoinase A